MYILDIKSKSNLNLKKLKTIIQQTEKKKQICILYLKNNK